MKTRELVTIWGAPEAPKLTPKQISIRLPIIVAAKLSALCDLYPRKTKTEIIGDLLASALEQMEEDFPKVQGRVLEDESDLERMMVYEDDGMRSKYLNLTEKYLRELEQEAGIKEPMKFNTGAYVYEEQK
jgi:hypothetical protein